jgi:hypothetical protein
MRGSFINSVLEKETFGMRFTVAPGCKEAIADFISTKEAPDGSKVKDVVTDPKTKARYQEHGHMTDLADYFFVSAFAAEFDKYQKGGRALALPSWGKGRAPAQKKRVSKWSY